jgi:hypothetical protein
MSLFWDAMPTLSELNVSLHLCIPSSDDIILTLTCYMASQAGEELWFLTFCLLWTMNFIAGLGSLMIAISVAKWCDITHSIQ